VATATLATSDNINVGFDARRVSGFTSYRGQVRLTTGNQVWLQADSVINNTMTGLGVNTRAQPATVATGAFIWVRAQITGTNPTTIRMKAWNDGSAEPSAWAYTVTDSTPVLQAPGAVGLLGWLSAAWNQGPITVSFDDFNVTSPISGTVPAAPVANFSASPVAGTLGVNFSNTSTGGSPDTYAWDFGDGSGSALPSPSHTYAAPGTYQVRLSTTNNGGSSSKTSTITVSPLPGIPVAGFSWLQQTGTLGVQFTDTSTNSPSSWSWSFGDGSPAATVQNPLHVYTAPGPYTVTLQAANGSGTGTLAQSITVNPLPVPVAGFTYSQAPGTLTFTFSDTTTNGPTSWAWTFGDGASSTSQNPVHTFASAGTYTVALTASNASGPSSPASQSITASATAFVSDSFSRSSAAGTWGSAPVGGAYSYVGSQADFSLTGSAGAINLGTAGATRAAYLPVSAQDVDLTYQFSINKLPTGGGSAYAYGSLRRSATADYRVKARIFGTGAVYLSVSQFSAGVETTIGSEVQVAGLTYVPGQDLKVHAQVSGTNPTTLLARLWPAGASEPGTWLVNRTDSTAALQVAGSVGLRAYSSSTTTNNPISVAFDNLIAAPITIMAPPAPVASFSWSQSAGTRTINFSDTSTNGPTSWAWNFGDSSSSSSQNPSHTYAATGTYTVTLTATNATGSSVPAASQSVTVAAASSPYASDTFARSAASGTWGSAQVGGAYTYVGSQADFSLTGSAGRINLPTAGANRAAFLAVSAQDVDLTYQFSISALPAGGGSVYTYGTVRHSATADYRVKVRVAGTGAVYLSFSQYSAGVETTIGSEIQVAGLTYVAGTSLNVHAQVSGTSPTALNARVWASSGSEPSSWQVSRTDSTAGLQAAGGVGLRAYTSAITTNTPITVSFDNFLAAPISQ
jgi:PKD repeat protein